MIFLDGNHLESEIMSEKVLLSVPLGEPTIQGTYKISCGCLFCYVSSGVSFDGLAVIKNPLHLADLPAIKSAFKIQLL